jgi:hypothetical protein
VASVTVDSISPDGTDFKINLVKIGADTATITIITTDRGVSHTDEYNVFQVRANPTTLTCTTTVLWWHPTVSCVVDGAQPPGEATITVTIANAPAHNGATDYRISASDGANIKRFIAAAAFPARRLNEFVRSRFHL